MAGVDLPRPGDPRAGRRRARPDRAAGPAQGRHPPDHAHHRGRRAWRATSSPCRTCSPSTSPPAATRRAGSSAACKPTGLRPKFTTHLADQGVELPIEAVRAGRAPADDAVVPAAGHRLLLGLGVVLCLTVPGAATATAATPAPGSLSDVEVSGRQLRAVLTAPTGGATSPSPPGRSSPRCRAAPCRWRSAPCSRRAARRLLVIDTERVDGRLAASRPPVRRRAPTCPRLRTTSGSGWSRSPTRPTSLVAADDAAGDRPRGARPPAGAGGDHPVRRDAARPPAAGPLGQPQHHPAQRRR